jgi:transposase
MRGFRAAETPGRRPRKTNVRAAMNAILYLLRTGSPWRYLPHNGFPLYEARRRLTRRSPRYLPRGADGAAYLFLASG